MLRKCATAHNAGAFEPDCWVHRASRHGNGNEVPRKLKVIIYTQEQSRSLLAKHLKYCTLSSVPSHPLLGGMLSKIIPMELSDEDPLNREPPIKELVSR